MKKTTTADNGIQVGLTSSRIGKIMALAAKAFGRAVSCTAIDLPRLVVRLLGLLSLLSLCQGTRSSSIISPFQEVITNELTMVPLNSQLTTC